jgi:twitching motility two-component system response regulator PilG
MPSAEAGRAMRGAADLMPVLSGSDPRPLFRVGLFGLAQRFERVVEIVLRHARHNPYRFEIAATRGPGEYDIAVVDMTAHGGAEVATTLLRLPEARPVVRVGRRTDPSRGEDDLLLESFTINLLKVLNSAVDRFLRSGARHLPVSPSAVRTSARPTVLIVDDSPSVRRQIALALRHMGLVSEGVASAQEGLDALARQRFELVLADVIMPGMDGYRFTRQIKRNRELRDIPVVILTRRSAPFALIRGALAGCSSYLVKPVSLKSLRDTVARHLKSNPPPPGGTDRLSPI